MKKAGVKKKAGAKRAARPGRRSGVLAPSAQSRSFSSVVSKVLRGLRKLGPGIVTGASDDDPSGIATYSQVGAQFGFAMLWTMVFSYPLMAGIQEISAWIGRVTGLGIAGNIRRRYSVWVLYPVVALLLVANVINLGADISAMGSALKLLVGGSALFYSIMFGLLSVIAAVFVPYSHYAQVLKWSALVLLVYVATAFVAHVHWQSALAGAFIPTISLSPSYMTALTAVFGTTISPYLFFWQASQEVQEQEAAAGEKALKRAPEQASAQLESMRTDTYIGMAFSNIIAFFIILDTAAVLHTRGVTDIQTAAQAAEALRPLAGELTFLLFSLGIIGTGLLSVPVLAGSAAYALAEAFGWPATLEAKAPDAVGFYGIIAAATVIGFGLGFTSIDPIHMLVWSAVLNGIVAVPIMAMMMVIVANSGLMGRFRARSWLIALGWVGTGLMALAVIALIGSSLAG